LIASSRTWSWRQRRPLLILTIFINCKFIFREMVLNCEKHL
jgi:hypothetical protein